jgi:membrane protein required for colicin V production
MQELVPSELNYIDVAIGGLVVSLFLKGLIRGLFRESVSLIGLIAAFLLAMRFLSPASAVVNSILHLSPRANTLVAFIAVFALSLAGFQILANLLHKLAQKTPLSWVERLGGGAIGFLKGAVIASLLALLITYIPFGETLQKQKRESVLFEPTRQFAPWLFDQLRALAPGAKSFYDELRDSFGRTPKLPTDKAQEALRRAVSKNSRPKDADPSQ